MNCNHVKDNLSAFVDCELDADQTSAIKAHLIRCPDCRKSRDQLERLGQTIRQLSPVTAPADFQFRVYSSIRRKDSKKRSGFLMKWQNIAFPIAAMFVGILIGINTNNFSPGTTGSTTMTADANTITETEPSETQLAEAYEVDDQNVIRNYNLDSYIRRPLVPVNVDTIPSDNDPESLNKSDNTRYAMDQQQQYVLDNVPMHVSYERTIY